MNRIHMTFRSMILAVLMCLASFALFSNADDLFRSQVNLALRQAGHHLLLAQNDSTSAIPPVEYEGTSGFLLSMESAFDYDALPDLLAQAFNDYDISAPYEVVIQSCEDGTPILGFNQKAVAQDNVACKGRDQEATCADILVRFKEKEAAAAGSSMASTTGWLIIPLLFILAFLIVKRYRNAPKEKGSDGRLMLGVYSYDPKNQVLLNGEEELSLTYRENKLLHLFASRPNQVLTRPDILSAVWEDEGVVVGRSLDVFISRLRKLLKHDPAVQIKSIHGVGYRLHLP